MRLCINTTKTTTTLIDLGKIELIDLTLETVAASWERISLPVDTVLFDLDFVKTAPEHGWLVGSKGTFLETVDSGETWVPRTFAKLDAIEQNIFK